MDFEITSLDTWEGLLVAGVCCGIAVIFVLIIMMIRANTYIPNFWIYALVMGILFPVGVYCLYIVAHFLGFWPSAIIMIIIGTIMWFVKLPGDPHLHQL